ncbi:putative stoned B-like protein [Aphelenchoides besseyi]|nr:putative stoned B-like protein [Aphelenchoides besseyi]
MDHSTFGYANHKADRRRSSNAARIAFRRAASTAGTNEPSVFHDGAEFDMDTLRKEERAIRSFTDSVEFDLPPAPELPASLDPDQYEGYGMRESSTADTIIEVAKLAAEVDALTNAASERFDRTLGETQKYRMAVPGPEQVDQEFEMHKSLLENAEEEVPTFADPSIATRPSDLRGRSTSIITTVNDRDHQLIRRQYSSSAVQRPRATTPTSWSVIDTFVQQQEKEQQSGTNEMAGKQKRKRLKDGPPPDSGAKIRVSIPTDRRSSGTSGHRSRHNSMSWSDFYESMEQPGSRQSRSGSFQAVDQLDFDNQWAKASGQPKAEAVWDQQQEHVDANANKMSAESPTAEAADRRQSAVSNSSANATSQPTANREETAQTPIESPAREEGHAVPVRVAPPPPPKKKTVEETEVTTTTFEDPTTTNDYNQAAYTGYGDQSQYYQGYGGGLFLLFVRIQVLLESYGAVGYDSTTNDPYSNAYAAGAQNYDYSNYGNAYGTDYQTAAGSEGYETTQYDPNTYNAAYGNYDQYYQGYDYGTTGQATGYDYSAGTGTDEQQPGSYDYNAYTGDQTTVAVGGYDAYTSGTYDPLAYNAGYDQYGLQTGVVGAEDTAGSSADASPRPIDPTTNDNAETAGSTTNYDYSQYGNQYESYAANDYQMSSTEPTSQYGTSEADTTVTVNEPDPSLSTQYGTTADYEAYGSAIDTGEIDYNAQYGSMSAVEEPAPIDPTTSVDPTDPINSTSALTSGGLQPFSTPLLPQQRARTPDPFSWEAQETNYDQTGTAQPPRPPRPAPVRTPEPDSETEVPSPQVETEQPVKAPPSRPAPPTKQQPSRPAPPSPNRQAIPPPMPPQPSVVKKPVEVEEEDPWARFKQMSEQASNLAKSTAEQLKVLSETTAAKDVKDESYIAQIGGSQGTELNAGQRQILRMQEEQKQAKADKKAKKSASSKKNVVPKFDPRKEEDVERQAAELVARMAAERAHDLEGWKPPTESAASKSDLKTETPEEEPQQKSKETTSTTPPPTETEENEKTPEAEPPESPIAVAEKEVEKSIERVESPPAAERFGWAGFDAGGSQLPTSESDFFAQSADLKVSNAFGDDEKDESAEVDESKPKSDPFAPTISAFDADPFDTRPIDEVIAEAKRRAAEGAEDVENSLLRSDAASGRHSGLSSPTPEGGSPISARPTGFEDDFKVDASYSHTPTPLYDEDDTVELEPFAPQFEGDGWNLMVRHPIKKKSFMSERCWKPCFARLTPDHMLQVFNSKEDRQPILEILLQASYSLSDTVLQAYDAYGKIHTVKLQHVMYKERVGIRAGQISRLVEGHITKYGLPLEHAAQINVLAKFASLDTKIFQSFISAIEDVLFKCPAKRDTTPTYKQDEVQIHCYDEYTAHVDKIGNVSKQRARVRMFCLSFLTGSPYLEIGLNDRRREGKEIVRRKDILPMYTERWIRFEGLEFHNTIDQPVWDEDQVIKLQPPDACFFEVMRFRVRPPRNREKPLTVKSILRMAGSKVEIRIDVMAAAQQQRAKGTVESTRAIPCEDIQIRFPIPEAWIYIFREERTWGVGSVHSKTRRPGKVKNIKDRLMGAVQHTENTLIEVAIGEAKYEHVHRSLVWRIPKLPKDNHQAYKNHLLKCRFQLSSFDLLPENFEPECEIEFTMPLATISNTVVRSVSVEQHEDSDRVEKFVRYVAKCHYDLDIEYLQVSNLDNENDLGVELKKHQTAFNPEEISAQHDGYKIAVDPNRPQPTDDSPPEAVQSSTWNNAPTSQGFETTTGGGFDFDAYARQGNGGTLESTARRDSSSEEEDDDDKSKFPMIQIDMSSYGY